MFKLKKIKIEEFDKFNELDELEHISYRKTTCDKKWYKNFDWWGNGFRLHVIVGVIVWILLTIFGSIYHYFNDPSYYEKTTLSNGETIKFISINKKIPALSIIGDLKERILDEEEIEKMIPNCSFRGVGFFNKSDSSLIAIKVFINNIKLIICKSNSFDINVPKVTNHMNHKYKINGVLIKAWYYCIRNHEKNNNDFVFCVYFKLGDKDVYLEKTLDTFTDKSEQIKLGEWVLQLTKLKQFDFSKIKY